MSGVAPAVRFEGIRKTFPPARAALAGVDLELRAGEILALLGENGAGKSTLVNVLAGLVRPDEGRLTLAGEAVALAHWSPAAAFAAGIGIVHQHSTLVPAMTVPENLSFGVGEGGRGIRFDPRVARARVAALAERYALAVPLDAAVRDLSAGERQRAEILRALERGARVLVLDEPTAALTAEETRALFPALRRLRDAGCGVIFISHKLGEIEDLADRVAVIRRGRIEAVALVRTLDAEALGRLMLGRDLPPELRRAPRAPDVGATPILALRDVSAPGVRAASALKALSLELRAGELVGVAGIDGNGQRELEEVLAGVRTPSAGHVEVDGRRVVASVRNLAARGIAQLSGERERGGLVAGMSVAENLIVKGSFDDARFFRPLRLDLGAARAFARERIAALRVEPPDPDADIATLSGGNAQKVALARELGGGARAVLAFNPTRGLDVGVTRLVHERLLALRESGGAVLVVSTELDEVLALADRVLALVEGRFVAVPPGADRAHLGAILLGGAAA